MSNVFAEDPIPELFSRNRLVVEQRANRSHHLAEAPESGIRQVHQIVVSLDIVPLAETRFQTSQPLDRQAEPGWRTCPEHDFSLAAAHRASLDSVGVLTLVLTAITEHPRVDMTQQEKANTFRALHQGPRILVLPNAWDVATARVFEEAGFPALATTSAGIANALGYPDAGGISRDEMLEVVARIARAVRIPVTADVEAGYGDPLATAKAVVAAGAVGMNLEDIEAESPDTLAHLETQTAIIRAIHDLQLPLVLNARTDIYLTNVGDPATRFARTVERLNAYREAGADCLFAPGVRDPEIIAALARDVRGPLNILATAGSPPVSELQRIGVARMSVGSGPARAALGLVRRIALELRDHGTFAQMIDGQIPYAEINAMLKR